MPNVQLRKSRVGLLFQASIANLIDNVVRENRSGPAPEAQAVLDQSAFAFESGFLFDQGADFGSTLAHGL